MIRFILNNSNISTTGSPGLALLDFIRYHQHLTGTKIGCREGDCGACSILVGEWKDGRLVYSNATSCLMALGNAAGKHIVTVEGINGTSLTPVQLAFAEEGATQCGFCTPGFIVSLTGYCMSDKTDGQHAIDAMNGNICRCTGYKSIQRAAGRIETLVDGCRQEDPVAFAVKQGIIPEYFLSIPERLRALQEQAFAPEVEKGETYLGGGTDLYVQKHESMLHASIDFLYDKPGLKGIRLDGDTVVMGASVTVTDIASSEIFKKHFPGLNRYIKLVSSTPIRNMATLAGNFTNASPIGDFTIFFLALDAELLLNMEGQRRVLLLRQYYKGYKQLDKHPGEMIEQVRFKLPSQEDRFHFEKVCKRTHLDIASVNTALFLRLENGMIREAGFSAGGVAPVPAYLPSSSSFLAGKKPEAAVVEELIKRVQTEIAPISDARGTAEYKRLLLSQLIRAHFMEMFPEVFNDKTVLA